MLVVAMKTLPKFNAWVHVTVSFWGKYGPRSAVQFAMKRGDSSNIPGMPSIS